MAKEIDFGLEVPKPTEENNNEEPRINAKKLIEEAKIKQKESAPTFVCFIIGKDGTGKTGIAMDYVAKLSKKTIIIDLDAGNYPVYYKYHKDNEKITIVPVLEVDRDGNIDYRERIAKIKALIKEVKDNAGDYSAIILDGVSTLLKDCEYIMRVDKNLAPDGGVSMRYWIQRNKLFTEILDFMKSIPGVHKFYVGHEDFIMKEEAAAVKAKTNQMIHQRIVCEKIEKDGITTFKAKVDKSKFNLAMEGKEVEFAKVEADKSEWNIEEIFKGLI